MVLLWVPGDTLEKHSTLLQCQLIWVIPIYWYAVGSCCVPSTVAGTGQTHMPHPSLQGRSWGRKEQAPSGSLLLRLISDVWGDTRQAPGQRVSWVQREAAWGWAPGARADTPSHDLSNQRFTLNGNQLHFSQCLTIELKICAVRAQEKAFSTANYY